MNTLALTYFGSPVFDTRLARLQHDVQTLHTSSRHFFSDIGIDLQTFQLATPPFSQLPFQSKHKIVSYLKELQQVSQEYHFGELSVGPIEVINDKSIDWRDVIEEVMSETSNIFLSCNIASQREIIDEGITFSISTLKSLAWLRPEGAACLRFGVLANCPAYEPLFPACYAQEADPNSFKLTINYTQLANKTLSSILNAPEGQPDLEDAKLALAEQFHSFALNVQAVGEKIANSAKLVFRGVDICCKPFPSPPGSVTSIIEKLTGQQFGANGTLFGTSLLSEILEKLQVKQCSLNRVVYSVLEDENLCQKNNLGLIRLSDLLLYSTVGGEGLSQVPLAENTPSEHLESLFRMIATLSSKYNKPLVNRFLLVPHKKSGERIHLTDVHSASASIMDLSLITQLLL